MDSVYLNSEVKLKNPHLKEMEKDVLFHLGLSTDEDLKGLFGDVKVRDSFPVYINLDFK